MTFFLYLVSFIFTVAASGLAGWLVDYLTEKLEGEYDEEQRGTALILAAASIPSFVLLTGFSDTLGRELSALYLLAGIPLGMSIFFLAIIAAFYLVLGTVVAVCHLPSILRTGSKSLTRN